MLHHTAASFLLSAFVALPLLAADDSPRIERLVPDETIVAFSVPSWNELVARFERTPLNGLWKSEPVQDLVKAMLKEAEGDMQKALAELGLDRDKLVAPEGMVAAAVYLEMDEEIGQKVPALLFVADFGDKADKAAEMIDAVVEKIAKDGSVKIEERELRGRTVRSIPRPKPDDAPADEMGAEDEEFGDPMGEMPDPFAAFDQIDMLHLARDGKRWFLATSFVGLEDALEVVDGQKLSSSLADSKDFQAAQKQLGDDQLGWAVVLIEPLKPLLAPMFEGGMLSMAAPFAGQLFGDLRAFSFGMGLESGDAMTSSSIGVLIAGEKVGLMGLMAGGRPKGDVPSFVGPDTVSFSRFSVKFAGVMPLVKQIVKSIPPAFAEQIELQLNQMGPMLEKGFADLGPEIYVVNSLKEPITSDSQSMSVAIQASKTDDVKPMIDMLAPAMGLSPQEFLGHTIYADEFSPVAVGLGAGWLSLGETESVEGVLRGAGNSEASGLAAEPDFRRALAALPAGDLVGWGYQDFIASYRFQQAETKAALAEFEEMKKEFPEFAEVSDTGLGSPEVIALMEKITPELLAKHVGPMAWSWRSLDNGFAFRWITLAPATAQDATRERAAERK